MAEQLRSEDKPMLKAIDFIPLDNSAPHCCIGYLSTTTGHDLYDAATLRYSAALGVIGVLTNHPNLTEVSATGLHNCIQAIRILSEEASALYTGAWQAIHSG